MVKLDSGVHSGESPVNGCSGLVSFCLQAAISPLKVSSSAIRRRRTRLAKTLNSISAMLSQLPCLGV